MKKIISLIVLFAMVSTITCHATSDMGVNAIPFEQIENAHVDISIFTASDIYTVEELTSQNGKGEFYITDPDTLLRLLGENKYNAVLEQIDAVNEENTMSLHAGAEGTSSNPAILNDGAKKTVTNTSYWFKCETRGATDFSISSTRSGSTITIYLKTLFGKKELHSVNRTQLIYTLSDCSVNNDSNTYLVNTEAPTAGTMSCCIKTHVDSTANRKGALWEPDADSAVYNTDIQYTKYWYVDKTRVSILRDMVSHNDFLDAQASLANGTISVSLFLTSVGVSPATGIASGIAGVLASLWSPFDFKQVFLDKIDDVAGYLGMENGQSQYERGCLLIEYTCDGMQFYDVKEWEGESKGSMTGPKGWTGTWSFNK